MKRLIKILILGAPDKLKQSGYMAGAIFTPSSDSLDHSQTFKEEQSFEDDDDDEEQLEMLEEV